MFLTWQYVVGQLLIGFTWLLVRLTRPQETIDEARERERVREREGSEDEFVRSI